MRGLMRHPLLASAAMKVAIFSTLTGCAQAAGTQIRPPEQPRRAPVMMVIGDSFTVGSGPVPRWRAYACEAARRLGWQPVIAGAGGTGFLAAGRAGRTFQQSFEEELAWRPSPDVLVVSGGHNDRRRAAHQVGQAAERLVRDVRARWPRTRIVLVGPIWLENAPPTAHRIRDAVGEAARREGVEFLDPMAQRWVTGDRAEMVLPDGVHPTAAGHARLAGWLAAALRP